MIQRYKVKNFKSLKGSEIKNFKRINLLGGKNNTGKTTLMESIFLFHDRLNPECFIRLHAWRGVQTIKMESPELFGPLFYNYDTDKKIDIEIEYTNKSTQNLMINLIEDLNKQISLSNINLNNIDNTTKTLNNEHLEMKVKYTGNLNKKQELITHSLEGDNNLSVNATDVNPRNIKKAVFLVAKHISNENENAIRYGELVKRNEESEIIEFLKVIEPRLKSINAVQLHDNTSMIYGDIGLKKKVPLNYMGDGITRIFSILLAIISLPNGIVFIDEIENGIHYSVMSQVWEMIDKASKKYDCQIVATTHSYECLASLVEGTSNSSDEINYIRLERKGDDIISKEYDFDMLEVAIQQGWEVR
ncbi:ATP/GTP-binding protein [Planococcus donghaensis]|uniref:AAA family ATPase n=1 Tax=Planococcus donghaensis TaxID=414778 RepID=UPI0037358432